MLDIQGQYKEGPEGPNQSQLAKEAKDCKKVTEKKMLGKIMYKKNNELSNVITRTAVLIIGWFDY